MGPSPADAPETPKLFAIGLVDELRDRKLAGAINGQEQIQLAFGRLDLSDIQMEEADGVAFEALPLRLVALDVG